MAFIKYIKQPEIPEKYRVNDQDNIVQVHSVNPKIMKDHVDLYLDLMRRKSSLSRIQREMIAVYVSALNKCDY